MYAYILQHMLMYVSFSHNVGNTAMLIGKSTPVNLNHISWCKENIAVCTSIFYLYNVYFCNCETIMNRFAANVPGYPFLQCGFSIVFVV